MRHIVTAIFYLTKTGCQWRNLPSYYPPWQTVYYHFRRLSSRGILSRMMGALRSRVRIKKGRSPSPQAAVIDSQSVRTGPGVSERKGWDGAKKLKGRKRHLVTDTLGLPLALKVGRADSPERAGLAMLAPRLERSFNLKAIYADRGYWGMKITHIPLHIVERPDVRNRWKPGGVKGAARGFIPVTKRWVIERSFAWITSYRRLAKDYEKRTECSEAMIQLAFIAIMLRFLTKPF
jgi:putative transposase